MILAAGLSPAWQRIMVFEDFQSGEVNRASEVVTCASGKVLNVAIGLKTLGVDVHCLSPAGGGPENGMRSEFEVLDIQTDWIKTSSPTRTCTTVLDRNTGQTTELVENAEPVTHAELQIWKSRFLELSRSAEFIVLSGSLPPNVPFTIISELLEETNPPAILDIRKQELLKALACRPFLIKPNREELGQTVGRPLITEQDVISAAHELQQMGAVWLAISDGNNPLIVVGPDQAFRVEIPFVAKVVNPIGCGDSLTAGIAAALSEQHDVPEAIRWGVACATQNLQALLPARLDRNLMHNMVNTISISGLSR